MEKNWEIERHKNKKHIYFVLDTFETKFKIIEAIYCYSYLDTEEAIKHNYECIFTYDLMHLSFDLLELGYRIYLVTDKKVLEVYPGMYNYTKKDIRFSHNLRRLLLGGFFDSMLGLDRNKFYYDNSKSTHELMEDEQTRQQILPLVFKVGKNTIGFDMIGTGIKAMTPTESYEWHKKHSKIDPKTGNMIISSDEIGDGTFEKKYPEI